MGDRSFASQLPSATLQTALLSPSLSLSKFKSHSLFPISLSKSSFEIYQEWLLNPGEPLGFVRHQHLHSVEAFSASTRKPCLLWSHSSSEHSLTDRNSWHRHSKLRFRFQPHRSPQIRTPIVLCRQFLRLRTRHKSLKPTECTRIKIPK